MTLTRKPSNPDHHTSSSCSTRSGMKLIVPLQGVVQGRGGLLLGSLIPCALFYFLQLYLKRRRSDPPSPSPSSPNLSELPRSSSRSNLSTRGSVSRVRVSKLATQIAKPDDDSPYYVGLQRVSQDPYDKLDNPNGIIQLGLSDNKLCLDLIGDWVSRNWGDSMMGGGDDDDDVGLSINGIATYQPFDGLEELKMVREITLNCDT